MPWTTLCDRSELTESEGKYAEVDGFRLAIFLSEGAVYVMDNHCPHAGGAMASGYVDAGCAVCPWHGWAFNLKDGILRGTTTVCIDTYRTRLVEREGGVVLVQADLPMP